MTVYKENLRTKFILGAEPTNTTRTMQMRIPRERNTKVTINPSINVINNSEQLGADVYLKLMKYL